MPEEPKGVTAAILNMYAQGIGLETIAKKLGLPFPYVLAAYRKACPKPMSMVSGRNRKARRRAAERAEAEALGSTAGRGNRTGYGWQRGKLSARSQSR